jgi:chemotaxis protein CheC
MHKLTELQLDALTEIFNIGMGRAAAAISSMGSDEVSLSVPSVRFVARIDAARLLGDSTGQRICSITQHLSGPFTADAMLVFPQSNSLEIVRLMVGDRVPLADLTDLEQEALTEIGNIILNACIGTMTNILGGDFGISLPRLQIGSSTEILNLSDRHPDEVVMLLHIDFRVQKRAIHGHVAFLQDVRSWELFVERIDQFLQNLH